MKIKEVEQLTGLTAKSIRHYESKGLLRVERDEENDYRSYTEENVQELKKIRLLRFLDFSIEQISELQQADEKKAKEILLDKAEALDSQSYDLNIKKELCKTLSEDGITNAVVVDEYNEIFDNLGEKWQDELVESLKNFICPSITEAIALTFIWLGPILWLFYNIHIQRWNVLSANAVLALLGTVFITGEWIKYFRSKKYQPKRVKKRNKESWYLIPAAIIAIIISIILTIIIYVGLEEFLFAPEEWLFYQIKPAAEWWLILWIVIPVMIFAIWMIKKIPLKKENKEQKADDRDNVEAGSLRKYWYIFVLVWIAVEYVCLSSVTYVTEDKIIVRSPFCPQGKCYEYDDVEQVEAFFGTSFFSLPWHEYKRQGSFSYTIYIDGKRIVFCQPEANSDISRYEEDTYLELEEFDEKLMQYGIPKQSDETGYEDCDFDKVYVDRFLRIINNR
ncbi:MAG: MerR family transcriptional regulator [Lachnospiraceae bacterium]|nr:MerR family transcriptional regulator [Lachnospiraceae bacterium]